MNAQEIQGQWSTLRGKVKEKWGQLTNDDLQLVDGKVDQLIGRIQQRTGEERRSIENFISHLVPEPSTVRQGMESVRQGIEQGAESVAHYAQGATVAVREGFDQVSEQAHEGYRQAEEMISSHPTASVGTVFALGLVAGLVIGMLVRSERQPSMFDSWSRW